MKQSRYMVLGFITLLFVPLLMGFSINGAVPGSSASMTPAACPTASGVTAIKAGQPSGTCKQTAVEFDNIGTANMYISVAPQSAPTGAASPAPVASTKAGKWIGPNQSWTIHYDPNSNTQMQWQICAEWDMQCDASGSVGATVIAP